MPYYPQNLLSLLGGAVILHEAIWLKVSFRALHLLAESHYAKYGGYRINHQVLVVLQRSSCKFFARYSQSSEVSNGSFRPAYKKPRVYSRHQWEHVETVDAFSNSIAAIRSPAFAVGIFSLQGSLWWKCSFTLRRRWKTFWRLVLSRGGKSTESLLGEDGIIVKG